MSNDFDDEDEHGARVGDLVRSGPVGQMITREVERETAPLRRQVEAHLEAAVDRELRLRARDAAEADVMAEADRRSSRRHLRSVDGA